MSVKSAERRLFLKKALLMGGGFCTTSIMAKYLTHCSAYFVHGNVGIKLNCLSGRIMSPREKR